MISDSLDSLPAQIVVSELVSSRYPNHERPDSWDNRKSGIDVIRTTDGRTLHLLSDGGQSPPKPGWTLIVSDGSKETGYRWTLYGLPRSSPASSQAAH